MDELIEKLAIAMHDDVPCPHPFYSHTEKSKAAWRQQAKLAIEFLQAHRAEFFALPQ